MILRSSGRLTRVRIDLAYDGQPFSGFARQPDQDTVQGTLEGALSRVLGVGVTTVCAGRTDAGVHALAQVVHFDVDRSEVRGGRWLDVVESEPELARFRLDDQVGDAVTIWGVRRVSASFDARFSATRRSYRYRIVDGGPIDPRLRGTRWHVKFPLSVPLMRAAARHLVGEHDFASLCRKAQGKHTRRRLDEITVARRDGEIHLRLHGPAFCHQMVRSITGCLVEVGRGRKEPEWMATVLQARDRAAAAAVAPPHGLTLERVAYGRQYAAAPWRSHDGA